ncbi:MAG: GNAT family N-acetyltransferase, partial [Thermoplasmata archaeon]|nr:GNAT family N-acetyltransferase [Thermoplasmata archaeon]
MSLRPIETEADARVVFRMMNNPEAVGGFVNFEPVSWETFQQSMRSWSNPPFFFTVMIIERNEDKQPVGYGVHFVPYPSNPSCLELGSLVEDPKHRGKGYTTETLRLAVDYLFRTKPIERIQASTS